MPQFNQKSINLLFELGMLKRQKHTGATLCGVKEPDSLADHTARSACIGFLLASLERADPYRTACILLFHDVPECRIGDRHKVSARYLDTKDAENAAFTEQISCLPEDLRKRILALYNEIETRNTKEGIVAKDADWLEMALTAREYVTLGYTGMQDWINNIEKALETKTAKQWLTLINKADPNDWWKGLKKMTYDKISKSKIQNPNQ